jgi:protein-S-isoprenylcysteine O-methyltransferase Ste14
LEESMIDGEFGGGLWLLVVFDSVLFIAFAASFFRPRTRRDWRVMGAFSAFVVALFAEMYGFPLTIYLLSGWLGSAVPALTPTHAGGHLLNDLIGWTGDPHLSPFHLASYALIGAGFLVLSRAWPVLWDAQRAGRLAVGGMYARVRHPQYVGFLLVMFGFLLQWPTLVTLVMFPILAAAYRRLAMTEEHEMGARFGAEWDAYARTAPRFVPRIHRPSAAVTRNLR